MSSVRQDLDLAWRHFQKGEWQQAEQLYLQVLEVEPDQVDALQLLAVIAGNTGRESLAIDYLRTVLRLRPSLAVAHNNLGTAFAVQGNLAAAIASFKEAVRLKPDYTEANDNLNNALRELRQREAAARSQQPAALTADQGEALVIQGKTQFQRGMLKEAEASFREALRLKPDDAETHFRLALALGKQGNYQAAVASIQRSLSFKPNVPEAYLNLGTAFVNMGKLDEATASYRQAVSLNPGYVEADQCLGHVLRDQGRLDDALAAFRIAMELQPDDPRSRSSLIIIMNLHPAFDMRALHDECRRWSQQHAGPLERFIQPHANSPDPERKLRIGYVSPDFRDQVDAFFLFPLLSNHDHRQVEVVCYANVAQPDVITTRLKGLADVWRSIVGLSDQQVADLVRHDQIDILIDLELHCSPDQLRVFARKPAPVQVTWLGYPGTTGLSTIDYRLTDPYLDPPGLFDAYYSEKLVQLPDTFWCYDPLTDQPAVNDLPALTNRYITFGCLNNFSKVNDECLSMWAKVLKAVPDARLLLLAPPGSARAHVLARFEQDGVAGSRVEFIARQSRIEYLTRYHQIDLALDPTPYNGHTTSLDGFWMGVPTVTLVSKRTPLGRAGWSQLRNLDLEELAAETVEQYVALAAGLAADLPRLARLRSTLRQRMQQSSLMDGKRFARHVESAYGQMWRTWCHSRNSGGA